MECFQRLGDLFFSKVHDASSSCVQLFVRIPIFDIEKCVCDAVKFRNKIGIDVCTEIVKNYLKRRNKNIAKLMKYAKVLRVAKTLSTYLEMGI